MCNNNNNNNQITDISTLQFKRKLLNFMKIISMQSNYVAAIQYPVSVLAGYIGGYPITSGFGRISKN